MIIAIVGDWSIVRHSLTAIRCFAQIVNPKITGRQNISRSFLARFSPVSPAFLKTFLALASRARRRVCECDLGIVARKKRLCNNAAHER